MSAHELPEQTPALLDRLNHQTYLTTDEAAIYLRFDTRATFYEFVHEYAVPKCKRGRINLFLRRDLDAMVQYSRPDARTRKPKANQHGSTVADACDFARGHSLPSTTGVL